MARTLYRIYLYFVVTQLLNFAAIVSSIFLGGLLQRMVGYVNPYGDPYGNYAYLRQSGALAVTAVVITAIFGGLHYWLIRRDIAHDPSASRGAVRAFFLNFTQASAAITIAFAGAFGFTELGSTNQSSVSNFGPVIAFGVLFALLEVERRRGLPDRGGALVLQRLNHYLIQFITLSIATGFVLDAIGQTVMRILLNTGYVANPCVAQQNQYSDGYCYLSVGQYVGGAWLGVAWAVAIWAGYGLLARGDTHSRLRAVFRYLSLAFGIIYALVGMAEGLHSLLRGLFGAPDPVSYYYDSFQSFYNAQAQFAFVSALVAGLAIAVVYWLWLRSDTHNGGVLGPELNRQASLALLGALAAISFWVGCALTLGGIFERVVPNGSAPSADTWAVDLAILLSGVIYIPLALWLSALASRTGVSVPRRAFVYFQLAFGTLGAVFSLIFVLYAFVTSAIGSPLANWQPQARQGVANIVIGALIIGIYVFLARREGWFTRQPAEPTSTAPSVESVESVLDDLLARRVSRDEAAARIRALTSRGS